MFKNKEDQRAYHREWYRRNKGRRYQQIKANRQRIKTLYREYKATLKCSRCPEDDPCCLDFHHVDDNKEHGISNMVHNAHGWKAILAEIEKCIVLCKNCHAKEHASIV